MLFFFFLMILRPPRSTRTDTLFPYTTLFRSLVDLATGEITSEVQLDSWDQERLTPVGDGLLAVKMRAAPATLALPDASTDELRVRRSTNQPAEDGRPALPHRSPRAGDVRTGWTKHHSGSALISSPPPDFPPSCTSPPPPPT